MKVLGKISETVRVIFRGLTRIVTIDPDVTYTPSGNVTVAASTAVAGDGSTLFDTELASGQSITIGGETRVIDVITDLDTMTVTVAFTVSTGPVSFTATPHTDKVLTVKSNGNATDEITTNTETQTLTNKTINSPRINEAVDLLSTSTELNQLDGIIVGGTGATDIVTLSSGQILTNKTLGDTNTINAQDDAFTIDDAADPTLQIDFDAAGTTGTKTTITSSQTTNKTVTLPDATDTLVGKATLDELSNKTLVSPKISDAGTYDLVVTSSDGALNTADRTLSLDVNDANRTINLAQDLILQGGVAVDINLVSPEEGDALLYDSASGEFQNKPSGDVSFQIQSMQTDGSCLIKGGTILVDSGMEIVTYDGAGALSTDIEVDITIDLDTVGGFGDSDTPSGTAISYIYIDMDSLGLDLLITDNGRTVRTVTESNFVVKTSQPSNIDFNRFIPVGYAQYDTSQWAVGLTDFGTTGRRRHDTTNVVTAASSYQVSDTATNIDAAAPFAHGIDGVPTNAILLVEDTGEWEIHDVGAYFNVTSTQVISTGTTLASIIGGSTNVKLAFANGGVAAGAQSYVTVEGASYPYTAGAQEEVMVDSSAGAYTVTLPANPLPSQRVRVVDVGDNAAVNNITVGRNANPIEAVAADFTIDISGVHATFVYSDVTNGWEVLI